jgi:hypothetical protein
MAGPSVWKSFAAESLGCPEIPSGRAQAFIGNAIGDGLFTTVNRMDLANEINESINRLQIDDPNISWGEVRNLLIAAYCRVVSGTSALIASEKWSRMHQFDSVLDQQISASTMPPRAAIIASIPLSPEVFRELRSQAAASHQSAAQLMAAILTRAAGR